MESLWIEINKMADVEFFTDAKGSIYVEIDAQHQYEGTREKKEISRETLKSYIDKLQEIYNNTGE